MYALSLTGQISDAYASPRQAKHPKGNPINNPAVRSMALLVAKKKMKTMGMQMA